MSVPVEKNTPGNCSKTKAIPLLTAKKHEFTGSALGMADDSSYKEI